jgi:hypothetical protein
VTTGCHGLERAGGLDGDWVPIVSTPQELLVDLQVGGLLLIPRNPILDQTPSDLTHFRPPLGIIEQPVDETGEAGDVSWPRVGRRPFG